MANGWLTLNILSTEIYNHENSFNNFCRQRIGWCAALSCTGTFVVNILGCFLIGLFNALAEKNNLISTELRLALTTGFCGGFTTFSTFANENMNLLRNGDYTYFGIYIVLSIALGIAGVLLGNSLVNI